MLVPLDRRNLGVPSLRELGDDRTLHARQIRHVTKEFVALSKEFKSSQTGGRNKGRVVTLGAHSFATIRDLSAWCDNIFSGAIPFGVFVDVYTVLQRIISFMDVASDSTDGL